MTSYLTIRPGPPKETGEVLSISVEECRVLLQSLREGRPAFESIA